MKEPHSFGGKWTDQKLALLADYLRAYTLIFDRNEKARRLNPFYVDAFAGTGYRTPSSTVKSEEKSLFSEFAEKENREFLEGSAVVALKTEPSFKNFLFIERSVRRAKELEKLKHPFPDKASKIRIICGDANMELKKWCNSMNWKDRAVVFLDPYGMEVEWSLIESLGKTRKIDLWLLFPLGTGVMRLLTKFKHPPKQWEAKLTKIFGTDSWKQVFYKEAVDKDLFGEQWPQISRNANFEQISQFLVKRLKTVFTEVTPHPFWMKNAKNVPLYLLCFASENPTGLKIANDLLKKLRK